ncbi:hypothetical protein QAD02_006500 [Eretmocerus hayati]|uniref:Uncharacterized protein n=1 Tax=Eretmocerus hayati TaxID=131215 RepID=A0ACC2N161_9HYME|nr:hypothetical protein QAD02_006500 [Eretmocerus hayati]
MLKPRPPHTRARDRGRAHKKVKTEKPHDYEKFVEESLLPAKNAFDGTQNPTVSYDDFCQMIIKTHASTDLINDIKKLHHEPNQMLDMIEKVYPLLASRRMESRLTRMRNKINKQADSAPSAVSKSETESEKGSSA